MRTKIIWQCPKCSFKVEHNIELIEKYSEPVCICGEYMLTGVELEQEDHSQA